MKVDAEKFMNRLLFKTNYDGLKWSYDKDNDHFRIFTTFIKITENKKLNLRLYDYFKNSNLTYVVIYLSIKQNWGESSFPIETIYFNKCSKSMDLLLEKLNRQRKKEEEIKPKDE